MPVGVRKPAPVGENPKLAHVKAPPSMQYFATCGLACRQPEMLHPVLEWPGIAWQEPAAPTGDTAAGSSRDSW